MQAKPFLDKLRNPNFFGLNCIMRTTLYISYTGIRASVYREARSVLLRIACFSVYKIICFLLKPRLRSMRLVRYITYLIFGLQIDVDVTML